MKICKSCKTKYNNDAFSCSNCGNSLTSKSFLPLLSFIYLFNLLRNIKKIIKPSVVILSLIILSIFSFFFLIPEGLPIGPYTWIVLSIHDFFVHTINLISELFMVIIFIGIIASFIISLTIFFHVIVKKMMRLGKNMQAKIKNKNCKINRYLSKP
jgi:hypothetical protein